MPYPFVLPTTSAFSFSCSFASDSHPSLPLNASTYRAVVRDTLKKHKRLPGPSQPANLAAVVSAVTAYLPYVLAVDTGLRGRLVQGESVTVTARGGKNQVEMEWRPTLSESAVPGVRPDRVPRVRVRALFHDIAFSLTTLAAAQVQLARAALHPLHVTSSAPVGTHQRQAAVATATRHLLDAAGVCEYLDGYYSSCLDAPSPPCPDVAPTTVRALAALAKAEATLLAVLKDDPYPAVVAADRNANDTEWMYKAPDIAKVRAHLFARLCLAAAEHAALAHSLCAGRTDAGRLDEGFVRYLDDLRRTSRAKACRFFGIDAELGGQTGDAIGWLRVGWQELGVEPEQPSTSKKGLHGLGRLRKEWSEKREDKKIEKGAGWGADAGRLEETRIIEMLEAKWTSQNDTVLTQPVSAPGPLLAQMPSGREVHVVKPFQPPTLDPSVLEAMRAPPDRRDHADDGVEKLDGFSSDEDQAAPDASPVGAFPGTRADYRTGTPSYY